HLMPYRFLPEDFERKYRSVWVDVPHHLFDAEKTQGLYQEFLDELEFAEKQGFGGLCVNEHHNNAYGLMPSPNIMAATLTRRTSQAALVVLANSLAAAAPGAAPARVDRRRWEHREAGVDGQPRLGLRLPLVARLQARPGHDGRLLGGDRAGRRRRQSVPCGIPPARVRLGDRRAGRARIFPARALLLSEMFERLGMLRGGDVLPHRVAGV